VPTALEPAFAVATQDATRVATQDATRVTTQDRVAVAAPERSVAPEAPAAPAARVVGSPRPARPPAPPATTLLPNEVALVQQAAQALASGDGEGAIRALDAHDRLWPAGMLGEESGALRVQALVRTGRMAAARTLARKLLDAHPDSVLAARFRRVLEGASDADAP
jgi:hypothetical protein